MLMSIDVECEVFVYILRQTVSSLRVCHYTPLTIYF